MRTIADYIKDGWVKILRTGKWTDRKKREHQFDEERLQRIADNYKEPLDFSLAPITATHDAKPTTPKLGKIEKLEKVGEFLLAKPAKVAKDMIQVLKDIGYRFVSTSLNPNDTINHLALVPNPAVAGLGEFPEAAMNFSQPEDSIELLIEFSALEEDEKEPIQNKEIDDKEENIMFGKTKKKKPDDGQPQVENTGTAEVSPGNENEKESGDEKADFAAVAAAAENAKKEAAELKKKIAAMEQKQKETEVAEFCKSLKPGVIIPKYRPGLEKFLTLLATEEETFDFSTAGDSGAAEKQTVYEFAKEFLESLTPQIPLDPLKKAKGNTEDDDEIEFADADDDDLQLHRQVKAVMKEKGIPYEKALKIVEKRR